MVFISNGNLRKSLSVTRSLGKRGIPVFIGEETIFSLAGFSRYCRKKLVYPSPERNDTEFSAWVRNFLCNSKHQVVFPMDEAIIKVMLEMGMPELDSYIVLPSRESYQIAADKGQTALLAQRAEIPQPWFFWPQNDLEFEGIVDEVPLPCVIKPCRSSGSRGILIARTRAELVRLYRQTHQEYPRPVIQEYIGNGLRFDVCFLFNRQGELKASFIQKELRHFPLRMGPSTAQESVIFPELQATALKMMEHLPWRGIIELEFMIDSKDSQPKLLDINPRFWNSLEMAVEAGVDFPWLYYQIMTGSDPNPVHEYRTGLRCQNILPGEILHFVTNWKKWRFKPGFWGVKNNQLHDDILSFRDPGPAFGFVLACLRYLFDLRMWRKIFFR